MEKKEVRKELRNMKAGDIVEFPATQRNYARNSVYDIKIEAIGKGEEDPHFKSKLSKDKTLWIVERVK